MVGAVPADTLPVWMSMEVRTHFAVVAAVSVESSVVVDHTPLVELMHIDAILKQAAAPIS